ncbi:protein translocase subunit SecD [Arenimonas sp.]|nr:protein translocase subunit SecD [Candidatus Parcubacteria bacterium]
MTRTRLWAIIIIIISGLLALYLNNTYKTSPFKLGLDLNGGIHLTYKADTSKIAKEDIGQSMETLKNVIEARVNAFGVSEPIIQTEGMDKLIVELPGVSDTQKAIELIGQTPVLEFALIEEMKGTSGTSTATSTQLFPTELTGKYIKTARVEYDSRTNKPQIGIVFDSKGADLFAKITKENIGKPLAILLDGQVISSPIIQGEILGGQAQISGQFSIQEANALARGLKYGALPVSIELIGTQTIGASLGIDALHKSVKAGMYGFIIVALFLILCYGLRGLVASVALVIYTILNLVIFKLFGIVLTSAGLAAFIISIGMAVDGNILIFSRMREELKRGKTKFDALEEGFRRAWPSIRDSNISSMITAIILYTFAASPLIKGFALVFFIGVAVSMFTSVTVSKNLLLAITKKNK